MALLIGLLAILLSMPLGCAPKYRGTPAAGGEFTPIDGVPPAPNAPQEEFDPEAEDAAIRLDASLLAVSSEPPSPEGGGQQSSMMSGSGSAPIAEREYVWGPDYVDECVAQFDQNNVVYYVIQDANYDVVALLKSDGKPSIQYTYEPYGPLQLAESFAQQPVNRLGHQGLFFERFDAGPYDPALVPGAKGLCYMRGRWYDPATGRPTSRDPNETALPVQTALAMNGTMLDVMLPSVDTQGTYSDGMNLYQYERSNPVNGRDPLGLYGWDEDLDDQISEWTGNRLYAIGAINEGARWAAIGLQTAVDIAAGFLPGAGLYQAFKSVEVLASGRGGFWDAVNIATAALPIAHGAAELIGLRSLLRANGFLGRAAHACNSFVAGTRVDTPDGPLPVEFVTPGVRVLTRDQGEPGQRECAAPVTGVSKRLAPVVLWVALATGQVVGMTPGHEIWTHQHGWTRASHVQVGETLLGRTGQPVEIMAVALDRTPTDVYDLQVDGTFTYFVDGLWVHNNSCQIVGAFRHHLLPRQFVEKFERAGLDIEEFVIPLEREFHKDLHGRGGTLIESWNGRWKAFFDRYPNATREEIMRNYGQLFKDFFLH